MSAVDSRVAEASHKLEEAKNLYELAKAEQDRVSLIALADKHPILVAVEWSTESEYNDEGGYYDVLSVSGIYAEDADSGKVGEAEDALLDWRYDAYVEISSFGLFEDALGGSYAPLEIAKLREVSF